MRLSPIFVSLIAAIFNANSFAQLPPQPDKTAATNTVQPSALSASLFYQILLGELSARSQQPSEAFSILLDAARRTNDAALYRRAIQIALQSRSGVSALQAAQTWSQAQPSSAEANRFVLQILLALNRLGDTLEPLRKELMLTPRSARAELIWALPTVYERASDKRAVVALVQKALAEALTQPDLAPPAWATVGRLWQAAGDNPEALRAARKAQEFAPSSEYPARLALSLMANGTPQAEALVLPHLGYAEPAFRLAYVKTLLGAQREADAQVQLLALQEQHPTHADAWLVGGALALQQGHSALAERQFQRYLNMTETPSTNKESDAVRRGRSQAFLSMAHLARQRQDRSDAVQWLDKVNHPDDILRAQIQRATLMAQQGQLDAALQLIRQQAERSAAEAKIKRSAEVQLLRDQRQYERARTTLEAFVQQFPDDTELMYELAMVHEKLGHLQDMENLLRQLIAKSPQDPHAYNALGYSLADRGLRLPEALELISKALDLAPNDPFIIDSLAWAHFRSGNHTQAERLLQQAFLVRPDAEIAAHLGEVLWQINRRDQAVDIFRRGLELNPENDTLQETIKRLGAPL